ncbi:MAG: TlpA family protein disulfide reductase [Bacteroidetes bacterium]|nr:TlpA family protein disulfide reductase [Bacteroidota bacterium]
MKIDPKYFNLFAVTIGVSGIAAIFYFTISYTANQKMGFIENLGDGRNLYEHAFPHRNGVDTLRAKDFAGKFVVIDFWATWSTPSMGSHEKLWAVVRQSTDDVVVLAAGVKDNPELTAEYMQEHPYNFQFVEGSDAFHELLAPGVPTQVTFGPDGSIVDVRLGFRGNDNYDELREILREFRRNRAQEDP